MNYSEIKQNELSVRSYDKRSFYGTDWVTEYTFISPVNLTINEFQKVLEGKSVCGELTFIKKIMNFANGKKLYKHICKAVMY